jgi:hypothetical protein
MMTCRFEVACHVAQMNYCGKTGCLAGLRDFGARHPAARWNPLPELRGTRAWIVVARMGCDSVEKVPFREMLLFQTLPSLPTARKYSSVRDLGAEVHRSRTCLVPRRNGYPCKRDTTCADQVHRKPSAANTDAPASPKSSELAGLPEWP